MPQVAHRIITLDLGIGLSVGPSELPVLGEDGQPIRGMDGQPKTEAGWIVEASDHNPVWVDGQLTVFTYKIPLRLEARDELVRALSGGVVLAKPSDVADIRDKPDET